MRVSVASPVATREQVDVPARPSVETASGLLKDFKLPSFGGRGTGKEQRLSKHVFGEVVRHSCAAEVA